MNEPYKEVRADVTEEMIENAFGNCLKAIESKGTCDIGDALGKSGSYWHALNALDILVERGRLRLLSNRSLMAQDWIYIFPDRFVEFKEDGRDYSKVVAIIRADAQCA